MADFNDTLALYEQSWELVSTVAQKAKETPLYTTLTDTIGSVCGANDTQGLYTLMQAPLKRTIETFTVETLINVAVVTMQRQLNPTALSKLLVGEDGLIKGKLPLLLELPQVVRYHDGRLALLSGNHRLGVLYNLMNDAGMDTDAIAAQEIQCLVTSVDTEAFTALLGESASLLTKGALVEAMDTTLNRLWLSANSSRTVSATEAKEYKLFSDVPQTADGVVDAFTSGKISIKEAFAFLSPSVAKAVNPPQEESLSAEVFPMDVFVRTNFTTITVDTAYGILQSFWSALVKKTSPYSTAVKQDGMVAVKAILTALLTPNEAYQTEVLTDTGTTDTEGNANLSVVKIPCCLLQHAIDLTVQAETTTGSNYAANLARNKSKIAATLLQVAGSTSLFQRYAERQDAKPGKVVKSKASAIYKF